MLVRAGYEIRLACDVPVPLVMALSPHTDMTARLRGTPGVCVDGGEVLPHFVDGYGNRITRHVCPAGTTTLTSDFVVDLDRAADPQHPKARQHAIADLPDEVMTFLLASRYCDSDKLSDVAWKLFGSAPAGWARVQAICDFVHDHITFGYQFGRPDKTASDVFREKCGVCRDFAHLAVAFCRAMNIPARYASGFLGDIEWPYSGPGDFCAWFEVYLDGAWHTFDARYNTPRIGRVLMVRGHDAAQTAMITSFGTYKMTSFRVWCDEIEDRDDADIDRLLETLPPVDGNTKPPAQTTTDISPAA